MELSLQSRTDLLANPDRRLDDRGDHCVIRTPTNPTDVAGNSLLLAAPLAPAELPDWEARFAAALPGAPHRAFEWAGDPLTDADRAAFTALGYKCTACACMATATLTLEHRLNPYLRVEPVRTDRGWIEVIAFLCEAYPESGLALHARRVAAYQSRRGPGDWWVARAGDGRVIAVLALYFGERIGRFQSVITHVGARRQGACRTLMHAALTDACGRHDFEQIVIAVEEGSAAQRLYASFGFHTVHWQNDVHRRDLRL